MTLDFLKDFHRPRIQTLAENTEVFAFETIPCIMEAEAIIDLIKKEFPKSKGWITFSCKEDGLLNSGEKFSDAVLAIDKLDTAK